MTRTEALRELELDAMPDRAELKRAYHRRLKVTKPEVDPAGFQRLREAYDLLRAATAEGPPRRALVVVATPEPAPPSPPAPEVPPELPSEDERRRAGVLAMLETKLSALGDDPKESLHRIELLDSMVHVEPASPELWERLFLEAHCASLEAAALAVLDDMEELHPTLAWRLRLAHLPRKTTTWSLRNPPAEVTLADRIRALEVLIEVHRWAGETGSIAHYMLRTLPASELETEVDALVQLSLRLAAHGFVPDAQLLVFDLVDRCPTPMAERHTAVVEWARDERAPMSVRQARAANLLSQEDTDLELELPRPEPRRAAAPEPAEPAARAAELLRDDDVARLWRGGYLLLGLLVLLGWLQHNCGR